MHSELPEYILAGILSHNDIEFTRRIDRSYVIEGRFCNMHLPGGQGCKSRLRFRYNGNHQAIRIGRTRIVR